MLVQCLRGILGLFRSFLTFDREVPGSQNVTVGVLSAILGEYQGS